MQAVMLQAGLGYHLFYCP